MTSRKRSLSSILSKKDNINIILNIILAIAAIIGTSIALMANQKAEESSKLANEANQIAKKALSLQQVSLSSDVILERNETSVVFSTLGCKSPPPNDWYGIASHTTSFVTLTNHGGTPISILNISAVDNLFRNWQIKIYDDEKKDRPIVFPYDLLPWVSRNLFFDIRVYHYTGKEQVDMFSEASYINKITWTITFGGNKYLQWETKMDGKGPNVWVKEAVCQ